MLTKRSKRNRSFQTDSNQTLIETYEANGSVYSIINWARQTNLDAEQKRAFEMIIGSFVLTFYDEAKRDNNRSARTRSLFVNEKSRLEQLVESQRMNSNQLILFLHGPGGSGKSTVIDLVLAYAEEYCKMYEEFVFTSRTIVITALSGVAATLILGETTHSALYLNHKTLKPEHIESWQTVRLLIIDEISFADKIDFDKIDNNLRKLKQNQTKPFGGINIVFFRRLPTVRTSRRK